MHGPLPLHSSIHLNPIRTVCTVPLIDSIHGQQYTIEPQGGGDEDGFARGAWDWSMLWKRVPLGNREKKLRQTKTEPYRYISPLTLKNYDYMQPVFCKASFPLERYRLGSVWLSFS